MDAAVSTRVRDILERTAVSFVEGFIGGIVLTQYADKSMWLAAATAGVTAAAAFVKSSIATLTGTGSASISTKV